MTVRSIILQLNTLVVSLFQHCRCLKMIAGDLEFLCAVHGGHPRLCSANSYAMHALDHAALLITDGDSFPDDEAISPAQIKSLSTVVRRLYRIYGHAYFHHRELYDQVRVNANFCSSYAIQNSLMREEDLIIPVAKDEALVIERQGTGDDRTNVTIINASQQASPFSTVALRR
jgi:hypothetical protein